MSPCSGCATGVAHANGLTWVPDRTGPPILWLVTVNETRWSPAASEPGFARTYLLAEQIACNTPPRPPALNFPDENQNQPASVTFGWSTTTGGLAT